MGKKRLDGLDIIRTLAIMLVFVTHYISAYTNHYLQQDIGSGRWFFFVGMRYLMILCVPLFLLLTGYLQTFRKPDRRHYASCVPVVLSWLVISFASTFFLRAVNGPGSVSVGKAIMNIFDFSFGYTWYVEMYLCLFLVLPFINILLDNLSKKQYIGLLITSIVLTGLSDVFRSFIVNGAYLEFAPTYFNTAYCITYYLIGAYIRRFSPRPNVFLCLGVAVAVIAGEAVLNYYGGKGTEYAWWMFRKYFGLTHVIASSCIFLVFYRIERLPRFLSLPFREIASCSFEMYLIAYVSDKCFYTEKMREFLSVIPGVSYLVNNTIWFALILNFLTVYVAARILRLGLVPLGNLIRNALSNRKEKTVLPETREA